MLSWRHKVVSFGDKEICRDEKDIDSHFDLGAHCNCRENSFLRVVVRQKLQWEGEKLQWAQEGVKGKNRDVKVHHSFK